MKVECTRGFGLVENPLTGEQIDVEGAFETDRETYEALDEAYAGFRVVDEGDPEPEPPEQDTDPKCGVNGCGRSVDSPEATCWQHGE